MRGGASRQVRGEDLVAHGLEGSRVVLVQERPQEAPLQLARRVYPFRQVGERLAGVLDLRFNEEGVTDVVRDVTIP